MFRLANLPDLLRTAAVVGIFIYLVWRYPPWRKRAPGIPYLPGASDEIDLLWAGMDEIATRYNQTKLRREHLLWAILSTPGAQLDAVFSQLSLDRLQARIHVATFIRGFPKQWLWRLYARDTWVSQELEQTLAQATRDADQAQAALAAPLHVFLALLKPDPAPTTEEAGLAQKLLAELGLTRAALARAMFTPDQGAAKDAAADAEGQ